MTSQKALEFNFQDFFHKWKTIFLISKISPSVCFWVLCSGIFCSVFVTMIFSPPLGVSFDVDIVGISVSVDVTTGFGVFAIEICQFYSKIQLKNSKSDSFRYLQKTIFGLWFSSIIPFVFDGEFFNPLWVGFDVDLWSIWPDNLTGRFVLPFDWTVDTFVVILAVGFCFWATILLVVAWPTEDTLFIWLTGICLADFICWLLCLCKIHQS